MEIDFFTPVSDATSNKSIFDSIEEAADNLFAFGSQKRGFIVGKEKGKYEVQLIECHSPIWRTVIKIVLLSTGVVPLLALLVKTGARCSRNYAIINQQVEQRTEDFVSLRLVNKPYIYPLETQIRYKKIFERAGIAESDITALQMHSVFFANDKGEMTRESIQRGFERLHFSKAASFVIGHLLIQGLGSTMRIKDGSLSLKDLNKALHRSDTGIFTSNGRFDPAKFQEIQARFAKVNKEFLTADELGEMRAANKVRDQEKNGQISGAAASTGEFRALLSLFADGSVVDKNGNIIPTISFSRLREFYTDGPKLFEEVAVR